ncbi:hypothetical protein ACVLV4_002764 [Rathayibacter agropyri]
MPAHFFPDTSVLCNFAAVDQLRLLETYLSARGRVVEAVAREIMQSTRFVSNLRQIDLSQWFGDEIRIDAPMDVRAVEQTRVARFGGRKDEPTKHLGESQTLHVIGNFAGYSDSVWLTEDRSAYRLARRRGIVTKHTCEILQALVAQSEMTSTDAYETAIGILDRDRPLLVQPDSARYFE